MILSKAKSVMSLDWHQAMSYYRHTKWQIHALLEAKCFHHIPIKITPHNTLNFVKGVIKTTEIQHCTNEEIVADTHAQGVIACRRISVQKLQNNIYQKCRNEHPTCSRCSQSHNQSDCTTQRLKCSICAGDYPSYSKSCPVWKKEQEIIQLKYNSDLTFREAQACISQAGLELYTFICIGDHSFSYVSIGRRLQKNLGSGSKSL